MMKQLLFFFLLLSFSIQSQDFTKVDAIVSKYPRFTKVEDLANKISTDFSSDENKARAAFYWLAKNIRYNLKEFYNPTQRSYKFSYSSELEKEQKLQALKDKLVRNTFLTKTGVCEEYAQSFKKVCDLLDIESEVLSGNVRSSYFDIGKLEDNTNHAWNAVKLNNQWIILDATWAAGYEMNGKWVRQFDNYFYNIPKEKILKTHYPEATLWMLRFGRMSLKEFYNQPIYGNIILNSKIELVSPKSGIIEVEPSKEISIKLKNLKNNISVYYKYNNQQYSKKPKIVVSKNISELKIPSPERNTELFLFFGSKPALQYKIKVK